MDRRKLLLLIGALVIAIGTALAARSLFAGASSPEAEAAAQEAKGTKVLIAQRALPTGTIITADSVSFQPWPKDMVQPNHFREGDADMNSLMGTVVRFPIPAGQPLNKGALVAPGDRGFLAAALGTGMRAVTIPVSAKTGVGGFVFPGDHVDLMLTQTVAAHDQGAPLKATETIIRNLRVLATDQSTETETENGKTVVKAVRTVTLEVTPKFAEEIAVAQSVGTLSLSLRSLADSQSELDRAVAQGTVKVPAGATKQQEEKLLAAAASAPGASGNSYVTGGDISRFQRRNPPNPEGGLRPASAGAGANGGNGVPVPTGPVVRVMRGKETTYEAVRGR